MSSRREFLKKLGIGSVAVAGAAVLGTDVLEDTPKKKVITDSTVISTDSRGNVNTWGDIKQSVAQHDLETKLMEKLDSLTEKMQFGGGINREEYQTLVSTHSEYMSHMGDKGYALIAFYYLWVGKAHQQFGETEKMMEVFNKYLTCNVSPSTHSKYCIEIGDLLFGLGKNEDAVRFYEYAKFKVPNAPVKRKIAKCLAS